MEELIYSTLGLVLDVGFVDIIGKDFINETPVLIGCCVLLME